MRRKPFFAEKCAEFECCLDSGNTKQEGIERVAADKTRTTRDGKKGLKSDEQILEKNSGSCPGGNHDAGDERECVGVGDNIQLE